MMDIEDLVRKCVSNVVALLVGVVLCLTFFSLSINSTNGTRSTNLK
jgi:hypothetical protein